MASGPSPVPAPAFTLTAVDADPARVAAVMRAGTADDGFPGLAGRLELPAASFDVVLYRLVLASHRLPRAALHRVREAARLLAPGGALVAIEPGLWHPVGAAWRWPTGSGSAPPCTGPPTTSRSPHDCCSTRRAPAGLEPELHAVTYTWRRLTPALQGAVGRLDAAGSRPRAARLGHTLMLIARRPTGEPGR